MTSTDAGRGDAPRPARCQCGHPDVSHNIGTRTGSTVRTGCSVHTGATMTPCGCRRYTPEDTPHA